MVWLHCDCLAIAVQWFGRIAVALGLHCNGMVALRSQRDCIAVVWFHCDRIAIALRSHCNDLVAVRSLCDQWIMDRKYVMACDQTIASVFRRVHNWEL
jgi:hypothetical protein